MEFKSRPEMHPHVPIGRNGIARQSAPRAEIAASVERKTTWGRIDMTLSNRRVVELREGITMGHARPTMPERITSPLGELRPPKLGVILDPKCPPLGLPPKLLMHRLILPPDLVSEGKRCG